LFLGIGSFCILDETKMPKDWQKQLQDHLVQDDGVCRILFIRTLPAPIHGLQKLTVGVLLCSREYYGLLR